MEASGASFSLSLRKSAARLRDFFEPATAGAGAVVGDSTEGGSCSVVEEPVLGLISGLTLEEIFVFFLGSSEPEVRPEKGQHMQDTA